MPDVRLGDICVTLGLLEPGDVERVVQIVEARTEARFGEVAIELGLLDDEGLARALAQQFRLNMVPAERLERLAIAPAVLGLLPRGLIRERMLIPTFLDVDKRVLSLLTADPTDLSSIRTAQTLAHAARVRLFVAPRGGMRRLVDRLLPPLVADETTGGIAASESPSSEPSRGATVVFEPDPERAATLRRLEALEGGTAEVVGDPEQVGALVGAGRADRVFCRRGVAREIEPWVAGWRRVSPSLRIRDFAAFGPSRWSAVSYESSASFFLSLVEHLLSEARPPDARERLARTVRIARALADEVGLLPARRDTVVLAALFADTADAEEGSEPDRFARAALLLGRFSPPYDVTALLGALSARVRGEQGPGSDPAAEVLYTARAAARAGDATDPVEALAAEATRHDAATLRALAAVLGRSAGG